jgi:predicted nucleic acid-binding protein
MTFLDTSFVIALINERDHDHEAAVRISDRLTGSPVVTTDHILVEIGNALARRFRSSAVTIIADLRSSPNVTVVHITTDIFEEAFAFYVLHRDKDWGMTDCISFTVMRRKGIQEALAFDRHFVQAGFTVHPESARQ